MGYAIIFETKICKLDNGDVIHFSLQGCNNDDAGRSRDDFSAKYYTKESWEEEIYKWESIERNDGFDLRIGSRYCNWSDYGKHLRTMTKRGKSFDDMKKERTIYGRVFDGITYYPEEGEPIDYPAEAKQSIDDIVYGIWYGRYKGSYRNRTHIIDTLDEIINTLKSNGHVRFFIGKERREG